MRLGNYPQARFVATRALQIAEDTSGNRSPDVAFSHLVLGDIDQASGNFQSAELSYKKSLEILSEAVGKEGPGFERVLFSLGVVYQRQRQHKLARDVFVRALAILENSKGSNHVDLVRPLNQLGYAYHKLGSLALAESTYNRVLKIIADHLGKESIFTSEVLRNLAGVYVDQGKFESAEKLLRRSLEIYQRIGKPEDAGVAKSLNGLAGVYYERGRYDFAEFLFNRVVAIYEGLGTTFREDLALGVLNLASIYKKQGKFEESERYFKRSIGLYEDLFGGDDLNVADALHGLSALYFENGRYDLSGAALDRSLSIRLAKLGPRHPSVALSLNDLGGYFLERQDYEKAEMLFKDSLAIREAWYGPDHPSVAESLENISVLYQERGQLDQALVAIRASNRIVASRFKVGLKDSPIGRTPRFPVRTVAYEYQSVLAARLLPGVGDPLTLISEAFEASQYARISDTAFALAQMAVRSTAGNRALANKVRALQDAIAVARKWDERLVGSLGISTDERSSDEMRALREKLTEANASVSRLSGELEREFPAYAELVSPEPLALRDAQRSLRQGEALLAYLVTEAETLLWVVRPSSADLVRLEIGRSELAKQVEKLRQGVDLTGGVPEFPHQVARDLYSKIFAPAVPHLDGVQHVILTADGPLQSLPFGLLITNRAPQVAGQLPWLVRQYAFTNLPAVSSLRALSRPSHKAQATEPFVGFGDPFLKGNPEDTRGISVGKIFARGPVADIEELNRLGRLPETAYELRAIAKTLNASEASVFLQHSATERRVKSMNLASYRVLAFSTHGLISGEFKGLAEPALVLTPPDTPSELDDGLLTASEVAALGLNADLVILSACNTASPDGVPGAEGFSGLTKAFFYAGGRTLLVSHWAVDSIATVALTTKMFAEAKTSVGLSEALRRSILALVDHPTDKLLRHPAMWAPFVVVGDGASSMH